MRVYCLPDYRLSSIIAAIQVLHLHKSTSVDDQDFIIKGQRKFWLLSKSDINSYGKSKVLMVCGKDLKKHLTVYKYITNIIFED